MAGCSSHCSNHRPCSPDMARLAIDDHSPDIFAIVCCNESFQLALDHDTLKTLLQVCRRAQFLLSSKVPRFRSWCQKAELCHPDGQLRIGLTPSDQIGISLHCKDQDAADQSWLVAQADQGNTAASYFLARILHDDLGEPKNESDWEVLLARRQRVFNYFHNAANAGHIMAQFHLAGYYRNGFGVCRDHTKAINMYIKLANHGVASAQFVLGRCYENGTGVRQGYDAAIEWYTKAADQGSEDGRLRIVFLRAWFSFIGRGVEQSDVDALTRWQEVRTKSSDPTIKPIATYMVGWMHYLGRGTQRNERKGIKIICDNQSDDFFLADDCLTERRLARSDSPASCKFFNLCKLGSKRDWLCKHLMAICLIHGFGTLIDRKQAVVMLEQLANEGHDDSQYWLGDCYYCELSSPKNTPKAFRWFVQSANQGNSYGQYLVGRRYYDGRGVEKDHVKAAGWFRLSAERGNRNAQRWLGTCYQNGEGVDLDIDSALFWYRRSAEQGNRGAITTLKSLGKW
ncbi:uncharacterized protein BJ171DRAFT_301331 [Polychytrium aggregatum]|uniref:uncharacterized protein n=1 Tax=Polychytrium aggregatum TaxID=110093 RepID=UPI0022FE20DC|nr:uncharacterized protein BJ171DRAFT_301331 [Polychytrium aggregatum]KAI9193210.1 hypothetical protein BJ171DRAFT_301331 [Polychytrium aggregatum]